MNRGDFKELTGEEPEDMFGSDAEDVLGEELPEKEQNI